MHFYFYLFPSLLFSLTFYRILKNNHLYISFTWTIEKKKRKKKTIKQSQKIIKKKKQNNEKKIGFNSLFFSVPFTKK